MTTSRVRSKVRCPRCLCRQDHCFCDQIPRIAVTTKVVVIMHYREQHLSTNTAKLAQLCLEGCEIRIRGQQGYPLDAAGLDPASAPGDVLFLFPSEDAELLTEEYISKLKRPITLVVPDGTWRQAAKTHKREPALNGIQCVKLPLETPSEYRLRKAPRPEALCTFEAIARALGIIEGPELRGRLEGLFRERVRRHLLGRGTPYLPGQMKSKKDAEG